MRKRSLLSHSMEKNRAGRILGNLGELFDPEIDLGRLKEFINQ